LDKVRLLNLAHKIKHIFDNVAKLYSDGSKERDLVGEINGYIISNAFTRDSTVMPHVLAIVEASVHPSDRLSVRPSHSAIVTRESSYCFQRVLAIAMICPSVRPSVCLSVTRVNQSKKVQASITKSSPSAA